MPSLKLPNLPLLRPDDFRLTTWLAIGACLSSLSTLFVPSWVALAIPALLILQRVVKIRLLSQGILVNHSNVLTGRWTARYPKDDSAKPTDKGAGGAVMFVLGARTLHPLGRLAPGLKELGKAFANAWEDAEANREKWGFLGKAVTLYGSSGDGGTTMIWLSYWKDVERLHAFAMGDSHRILWDGYLAKKYSNLGIMHETYYAPKGNWETIYHDFHPFGMGDAKFFTKDGEELESPLIQAKDAQLKTMLGRMGAD